MGTLGPENTPGSIEQDWLGAPMYWSHFDAETSLEIVGGAGLHVREEDVVLEVEHDGQEVRFLWVVAHKGD